jgi:mono/diheme cytochrome c family protein
MPTDVQNVLRARCILCHGNPPLPTVPGPLLTVDDFRRPAKSEPGRITADVVVKRITSTDVLLRMPPVPGDALTAAEIQTLRKWIESGMPLTGCTAPPAPRHDGGSTSPPPLPPMRAPTLSPPLPAARAAPPGSNGTSGSSLMQPGVACINCHSRSGGDDDLIAKDGDGEGGEGGEGGPRFTIAGTVFPSAHEPNQCYGSASRAPPSSSSTAPASPSPPPVNSAGNFFSSTSRPRPLPRQGRPSRDASASCSAWCPTGHCNMCHTQTGATVVSGGMRAPGRILLP